jgi:plastocyanin
MFVPTWLFLCVLPSFSEESLILRPDKEGVQRATITMESYVFAPKELVVDLGKPVELTLQNDSFLVPHNFLLDSPAGERLVDANVSSGEIEIVQFTPTTPGTYPFYCDKQLLFFPNHRKEGMEGTIVVR